MIGKGNGQEGDIFRQPKQRRGGMVAVRFQELHCAGKAGVHRHLQQRTRWSSKITQNKQKFKTREKVIVQIAYLEKRARDVTESGIEKR